MKKFIIALTLSTFLILPQATLATPCDADSMEKASITAIDAIKKLEDGNLRFSQDKSQINNISSKTRQELKGGQHPYAIIVSCSDSRVAPELIFNTGLGEIFGVRLAGNVVDDDALGSIEFAAGNLNAPLIAVIGHEQCGAVEAAYNKIKNNENVTGNIKSLTKKIAPVIKKSNSVDDAIHKNAENVANEISNNKVIKKLISENKVKVISGYYGLDGKVTFNK